MIFNFPHLGGRVNVTLTTAVSEHSCLEQSRPSSAQTWILSVELQPYFLVFLPLTTLFDFLPFLSLAACLDPVWEETKAGASYASVAVRAAAATRLMM